MKQVTGEYADVQIMLPDDEIEDTVLDEISAYANSRGAVNDIVLMPDTHPGGRSGIPIGTTMRLPSNVEDLRVMPSMVGSDIGCGMEAVNIGDVDIDDWLSHERAIRDRVPMGTGVTHTDADYHMGEDFPYAECERKLNSLADSLGVDIREKVEWFDGYDIEYFKDVVDRAYSGRTRDAINSMGTLGAGNHFIEVSKSGRTGDYWIVIHSGSRGPGNAIASYWKDRATEYRNFEYVESLVDSEYSEYLKFDPETASPQEMYEWVTGAKGETHIREEAVREAFEGKEIEETFNTLNALNPSQRNVNTNLDFLEGEEALGYFVDMVFAQTYAVENRKQMVKHVTIVLGSEPKDSITSTHNYIDFEDLVVRKGATRAHEDERLVIPFNMADGAIIAEGRGNTSWHRSAPHGAGRRGSRAWAYEELDHDAELEKMNGIQASKVPEDEAPGAYKNADLIIDESEPTIDAVERLEPVMNIKAE